MPYAVRKNGSTYEVVNTDTGEVHAKHTTKAKAEAQVRLLEGEHKQEWKPDVVHRLPNGTVARVKIKNKDKYHGIV